MDLTCICLVQKVHKTLTKIGWKSHNSFLLNYCPYKSRMVYHDYFFFLFNLLFFWWIILSFLNVISFLYMAVFFPHFKISSQLQFCAQPVEVYRFCSLSQSSTPCFSLSRLLSVPAADLGNSVWHSHGAAVISCTWCLYVSWFPICSSRIFLRNMYGRWILVIFACLKMSLFCLNT